MMRFFFPFGVWAMQSLDLTKFDIVLQSSTHCAKYVKVSPSALVITYCHTPFRLVWRPESYDKIYNARGIKRIAYNIVRALLKRVDLKHARRTDYFLANSKEVVERIKKAYTPRKEVEIIHPSVKCSKFYVSASIEDYYLVVSRFEPYKKVDLVVKAFTAMPNRKLIVVGKGSMEAELKAVAGSNIRFESNLSTEDIAKRYSLCKALIFPQHEDYGITPLEANASGRPVIAYGVGGVLETMLPYNGNAEKSTAVFFPEQTEASLREAVDLFETINFDPDFIRQHAETFDDPIFVKQYKAFVDSKIAEHFKEFAPGVPAEHD
ncbi:MAG: glycosyltransferase [Mucilaginibacter polytrichastri]|nr:glycosyltransferase [Mucilaginibacter polytrichastri]